MLQSTKSIINMKRYLKAVALAVMVALAAPTMAQLTHTAHGTVDENAKNILKKAANKFNGSAVSFDVTMITRNEQKVETGKVTAQILYKSPKYRVTEKDKQTLYCDGAAIWHWNKGTNEVTVNKPSDSDDDLMNPAKLLANYEKHYRAKYIRQEDNGTAVIDLTPLKAKSYHKLRLLINAKTGTLIKMEVHQFSGARIEYTVSAFKSGVACTDADFRFDASKAPGVEVIDMR